MREILDQTINWIAILAFIGAGLWTLFCGLMCIYYQVKCPKGWFHKDKYIDSCLSMSRYRCTKCGRETIADSCPIN